MENKLIPSDSDIELLLTGHLKIDAGYAMFYTDDEGRFHRDGGPAVIFVEGGEQYYKHGLLHREDGPAVVRSDNDNEYWLNGLRADPF